MFTYPESFKDLIEFYKKLPGVGEKTAERMALATLKLTDDDISFAANSLIKAKEKLHPCKICGNLTDEDTCQICSNELRDKNVICVVEDFKSIFAMEKSGTYKGVYHVLNGLISPIDDISIEDIGLDKLSRRVKELDKPELIIALKSSLEGETTTLYIKKIFEGKNVLVSRLSYGIPMGAEIDYLDMVTLDKALKDRKKISD
jgi:recombination protein RecR